MVFYTNIVEEIHIEDTKAYNQTLRTSCDIFKFIVTKIDQDTTIKSGDLKAISLGEQLLLTLPYLATGESHHFLCF